MSGRWWFEFHSASPTRPKAHRKEFEPAGQQMSDIDIDALTRLANRHDTT